MPIRVQYPEKWDTDTLYVEYEGQNFNCTPTVVRQQPQELKYICLQRGPIVLGDDSRFGKPADAIFDFDLESTVICNGKTDEQTKQTGIDAIIVCRVNEKSGVPVTLIDYASAGKDWKAEIAAWIKCKTELDFKK